MKVVKGESVESELVKVIRYKKLNMNLPPLEEGREVCKINPYILHAASPKHSCVLETEEVYMTKKELKGLNNER